MGNSNKIAPKLLVFVFATGLLPVCSSSKSNLPRSGAAVAPSNLTLSDTEKVHIPSSVSEFLDMLGEGAPIFNQENPPRMVIADLDMSGSLEIVLVFRNRIDSEEYSASAEPATDWLIVYQFKEERWKEIVRIDFDATYDGGTLDYEPGILDIRVMQFPGKTRKVLTFHTETGQGGHDPRWAETSEIIIVFEDNALVVLMCPVESETIRGPWRTTTDSIVRSLDKRWDGDSLVVRVDETSREYVFEQGLYNSEEKVPVADNVIEKHRSTRYIFQNGLFGEEGSTEICRTRVARR